jgi:DNA-binding transcriptional regulator GbsR (MarR family)
MIYIQIEKVDNMRTIAELSKATGLSKQAVYKRVNQPNIKPYLSKVEKVIQLSDEGCRLAFNDFEFDYFQPQVEKVETVVENSTVNNLYEALIQQQRDELKRLNDELNHKNEHVNDLTRMLNQSQILQKQLLDQIQLLSAPQEKETFSDQPSHETSPQELPKTSIWSKIFGNN